MGFFKELGDFLIGKGVESLKRTVDKTIKDVEVRVERATIKVIKTSVLFLMMIIGGLFMLVGLSTYLNNTIPSLANGLGTILIGAILIILALFVRLMK